MTRNPPSDALPCSDCGCPLHTSRQSRGQFDWLLCEAHDDGHHERGRCDPKGSRHYGRELRPCGTYAAYKRHIARGEPVDEACREAARSYSRTSHDPEFRPPPLAPCGTKAAYRRHLRGGEEACDACRSAWSVASRNRKKRGREAGQLGPPCACGCGERVGLYGSRWRPGHNMRDPVIRRFQDPFPGRA